CLRRVARVEPPRDIPITPAPDPWRYRSRAQWQYDSRHSSLGYFERGSHKVCDVVECPVIIPALQEKLTALREEMRARRLPGEFVEFQAAAGDRGVTLAPPAGVGEEDEGERAIAGERYRFDAGCFFQINHALLEPLVREALKDAAGGAAAVDLYCGVGLFTLPLARRFARVVGVESNLAAGRYARRNLADAGLTSASVETAGVGEWLAGHAGELAPVDFVLLDPPRAGAETEAVEGIIALRPRHISYVSCDPATLARDLRVLISRGYRLESVAAFDMFPQTHHVETIAHLTS
ncbi:MAG: class I SAM-dependent RNA methyltransferase, partial [Pyrinomonadaceae bacterium]